MSDAHVPRPSFERRASALSGAAFIGVTLVTIVVLCGEVVAASDPIALRGIDSLVWVTTAFLLFGSLIGVPICLAIGLPLWCLAESRGRQTRRDASRYGLIAGAGLVVLLLLIGDLPETTGAWLEILTWSAALLLAGPCVGSVAHRLGYPRA